MRKRAGRSLDHKALEDIRIQAVQRVEAGEAPSAVMRVMGFACTVIYDWLNKYRAGGIEALRALPIPGRPPKLTEQQRAWVYRTVTQNNPLQLQFEFALWTRAMVRDLIRQNCGVTLSLASVGRLLRSLGLTPQRPVRRAIEQVPARVREWLTVDYPAIQAKARNAGAQIFFADEAGGVRSNSHHSGTTWAPMGQTPVVPATGKRFGLNLVSAVSPQGVRLFFVEEFLPYSWAFLPADASLQCSFRGDSNQANAYPRLSGGQPSLETVPNTVGLSPSGALPSGHSRGVLVRFHGQGDRPVMAVTTGFQGRRFDVPEARTGVPRIDLPSPAPCVAADAVFADAKAFLSSNEARQMSESELERELHRRGQKLVRKLLQGHHDQRSPGQAAGPAEDASGVECSARREHESHAETTSGTMQVVGLGCARRGHDGLHPLDAALNLLPERSLVDMRRRVTIATASRAPPRTPWKLQWYSTLSTWQRRCGVRCSSPAH